MSGYAPLEVGIPATQHRAYDHLAVSLGIAAEREALTFRYLGVDIRTVVIDGEPWFVAADVAAVLGYRMASDFTRRLDDDEKGTAPVRTLGGVQAMTVISESGLYIAVIGSQVEGARAFKRWITHDVIPQLRRTGTYSIAPAAPVLPQSYAEALRELAATVEARDALAAEVGTLTPRAEAWDELAEAGTDYAVGDAAKILARAGIETGPQRLFEKLGEIGWIYRGGDRAWRAYARAVDEGYLAERAQPPRRNSDDILVPVAPQVRVTSRGLERLRVRLGVITAEVTR